jgi:protein O-GlcNAc transferase
MNLTVQEALLRGIEAHKTGKLQDAERYYRAILRAQPRNSDANHNLGVLAVGVGKPEDALPFFKEALEANPKQAQFWLSYIDALFRAKRLLEAVQVLKQAKETGLAGELFEQLEKKLMEQEDPSPLTSPDLFPEKFNALVSSCKKGDWSIAEKQALAFTEQYPMEPFGWKALGTVFASSGRIEKALEPLRHAVELNSSEYDAHNNLGITLKELGRLREAEQSYREAIRLKPDYAQAHNNLGNALKDLGRLAEAEASYREAIRISPGYDKANSNLLFSLNYVESVGIDATLLEARRYGNWVSSNSHPKFKTCAHKSSPPKLRIGFVSGDFRNHPVGLFFEGLIKQLDSNQFESYAFSTTPATDDLTERIKPYFKSWNPIYDKTDLEAATVIHERGIHVLFDLSGHSGGNRLKVFSYKPAPIQVTWLGYFATTGLPEMDFILGDPTMSPESEEHHFTERVWRLPKTWLCMSPPSQSILISSLPALTNGYLTFGCFGNLSKMNDQVIYTWSRVLESVPKSKLFLKSKQLADPQVIEEVQKKFSSQGVPANRLIFEEFSSRHSYLEAYNVIDVVLDTFPYPGGTTSIDALWMGVPILTLKGNRFLSHLGESIAKSAGHANWIAQDQEDYVKKAVLFASDLPGLAVVRQELRERILTCPLFDVKTFAKDFGGVLWDLWKERTFTGQS